MKAQTHGATLCPILALLITTRVRTEIVVYNIEGHNNTAPTLALLESSSTSAIFSVLIPEIPPPKN